MLIIENTDKQKKGIKVTHNPPQPRTTAVSPFVVIIIWILLIYVFIYHRYAIWSYMDIYLWHSIFIFLFGIWNFVHYVSDTWVDFRKIF